MFRWIHLLLVMPLIWVCTGCDVKPVAPPAAPTKQTYYQVKGVIKELKPQAKSVTIKHEEVPNYMPAMTMPFDVKDTNELAGLAVGDSVTFRLVDAGNDAWIDHIKKLDAPTKASELPASSGIRVVRDLLEVGDPLPDHQFTNELGQTISTSQFKGQALAFTFFFTRCPYPTFCPLMSNNFKETYNKLQALLDAPKNWHLLSISFDPQFDSPSTLKTYAQGYQYNPAHWNFVSGDPSEINAIADEVGETFAKDDTGSITHNLRTVVVDAQGHIQKIIEGNKWTSDELVAEIIKAAGVKQ